MSTPYHAKFLALELTRRAEFGSPEMFAHALSDAQVDLNPHQVDAALFAARSPISKGALLADEVGLGKTIEAALLLAQRWAEKRRKLLIIVPANLRKQWSQELLEKFHLPSIIVERRTLQIEQAKGNFNPFKQDRIVIVSYPFAAKSAAFIKHVEWDMVVIDEAHRLRNVYKKTAKNANIIKNAVADRFKVLLTATPLQNSLLELYGLVSLIDEYHFGSLDGFKERYGKSGREAHTLKERLSLISKRTLRADVRQFVRFTERRAMVQEFVPSDDEHELYESVSDYLAKPTLFALPNQQRQLMTMVLRKLLASSTFAIANTLGGIATRLELLINKSEVPAEAPDALIEDLENYEQTKEEWEDEDDEEEGDGNKRERKLSAEEIELAKVELEQLQGFRDLALRIKENSKGSALITALQIGFQKAQDVQQGSGLAQKKALIFTESRKTQEYLREILESEESGFRGKVVLFNGTNSDPRSKEIYERWLKKNAGTDKVSNSKTADIRAALVDHFREDAEIMLATEAAAEGINLQFCNLVVNYDLPWNPQRVEQRIGRCHRYGQKHDVVVVNFINTRNAADRRVYELLKSKFLLFESVFGASDQVLGQVDPTGVSFEKRIHDIYQTCRTKAQIEAAFTKLERELEVEITRAKAQAREDLMSNFDQSVVEKVRVGTTNSLDAMARKLWSLTRHVLADRATFENHHHRFHLAEPLIDEETTPRGLYVFKRGTTENGHIYRIGHPLALRVIDQGLSTPTPAGGVEFALSRHDRVLSALNPFKGKEGWLEVSQLTHRFKDGQSEDHIIAAGIADDGSVLEADSAAQLFECSGRVITAGQGPSGSTTERLRAHREGECAKLTQSLNQRTQKLVHEEMTKLDGWEEDQRAQSRSFCTEIETKLKEINRSIALCGDLREELELEEQKIKIRYDLDREEIRYSQQCRDLSERKLGLIKQKRSLLSQEQTVTPQFRIRWRIV